MHSNLERKEGIALLSSRDMALLSSGDIALLSHWRLCSRHCLWLIRIYLLHDYLSGLTLAGLTFGFTCD